MRQAIDLSHRRGKQILPRGRRCVNSGKSAEYQIECRITDEFTGFPMRVDELGYEDRLQAVASRYREMQNPDGGWPMRLGGDASEESSILGTSYGLSILRWAGAAHDDPVVRRGLHFLVTVANGQVDGPDGVPRWLKTRHPVAVILGLTEWRDALLDPNDDTVATAVTQSLRWLREHIEDETGPAWPGVLSKHRCWAWTSIVLFALGRLRARSVLYRRDVDLNQLIVRTVRGLNRGQLRGDEHTDGSWPACAYEPQRTAQPSAANTALAVIALSHRYVEAVSPEGGRSYELGRDWLLRTGSTWSRNENGEFDPAANDGWQHLVWSLAPRALLSARAEPDQWPLYDAVKFAFGRWHDHPAPGYAVTGSGITGYSNWSTIQLGQALKLAIARKDPLAVLDAIYISERASHTRSEELELELDVTRQRAFVKFGPGPTETLDFSGQGRRWRLLLAFAERGVQPNNGLRADDLLPAIYAHADHPGNWGSLKGLTHSVNVALRATVKDNGVSVFSTFHKGGEALVVIRVRCILFGDAGGEQAGISSTPADTDITLDGGDLN
jgi:hypothetical protein